MNYKKYQEEVQKARDAYHRISKDVATLDYKHIGTDYHVSLCRELLRAATLIRALESVDIPVKEVDVHAEL